MIVVDASLAVKWFTVEDDREAALEFLVCNVGQLCGPDLLLTETASGIVRRGNAGKVSADEAQEALDNWRRMWSDGEITFHRLTPERLDEAGRIALTLGHPLADCVYLQLAMEIGRELATCDAKFQLKAARLYEGVKLLADYG